LRDVEREMQEAPAPAGEVERLRRELADLNDRHLRLVAEFDNYRRRTLKEKQEMGVRAQATLATSLLESLDDLARVTSLDTEGADAASFVEGVELLSRKLLKSLAAAGLEVLNPLNEKFDPAVHEAVATEAAESEAEEDTISSVFQAGYLFKGLLLRPARVAVRKWNG
jgi:molecular chaperone GrpE